jgi:OmpA-OmpF porin, OOP family
MKKTVFPAIATSVLFVFAVHAAVPHVVSASAPMDAAAVSFQAASAAWRNEGIFPNLESISKMQPGLSKHEVYTAFGKPHFSEGIFAVRQWDYIFKFNVGEAVEVCQYQVHFDKNFAVENTFWNRSECVGFAAMTSAKPSASVVVEKIVTVPAPVAVNQSQLLTIQSDALFAFGKSSMNDLLPGGRIQLKRLAKTIATNMSDVGSITITGHTDRLGSDDLNNKLSQARADTIRFLMAAEGVAASKIKAVGVGSSKPVKTCPGAVNEALIACLQDNRRIDIEAFGLTPPKPELTAVVVEKPAIPVVSVSAEPTWKPFVITPSK